MKHQFNQTFALLINKYNAGKPNFDPGLGPLGANLGQKNFFRSFSSSRY